MRLEITMTSTAESPTPQRDFEFKVPGPLARRPRLDSRSRAKIKGDRIEPASRKSPAKDDRDSKAPNKEPSPQPSSPSKSKRSKDSSGRGTRKSSVAKAKNFKFGYKLSKRFLKHLMKATSCKKVPDLKNKILNENQWKTIEDRLSVHRTVLKNHWYLKLHMQLFCPEPLNMKHFMVQLIQYLYENKGSPLDWEKICLKFDGVTSVFLSRVFDYLSQYAKKKIDSSDLNDVIDYLYKCHIPEIKNKISIVLPRLDHILRPIDNITGKPLLGNTCSVMKGYAEGTHFDKRR